MSFNKLIIKEYKKQIQISLSKGNETHAKQFKKRLDALLKK